MDFTQRNAHHNQSSTSDVTPGSSTVHHRGRRRGYSWLRLSSILLLFSSTILVVALIISIVNGSPSSQVKFVNPKENQAIFLSNGQVYFGHIKSLNDKYIHLVGIYYLQVNQQVQPDGKTQTGNPTLVPLGCELHRPENEMLINTSQVTFWENLKNDANENTVPGAVKKDLDANPNGHTCSTTPTSSKPTTTTPSTNKQ